MSDRILLELFIVIMGVHIVVSVIIAYLKLDAEQRRREVDLKLAEAQGRMMTAKPLNQEAKETMLNSHIMSYNLRLYLELFRNLVIPS